MSNTWKPSGGGKLSTPAPEGRHLFRIRAIIDLGTVIDPKYNNRKHEVKLQLELVDTNHVFNQEKGEQPFVVSRKLTFSMNEKANMRKFFEQMRGKKITEEEVSKFDLSKWLNFAAEAVVEHITSKEGNPIAVVNNVMPKPANAKVAPLRNKAFIFRIDDPSTHENWALLNQSEKKRILESLERDQVLYLESGVKEEQKHVPVQPDEEDPF